MDQHFETDPKLRGLNLAILDCARGSYQMDLLCGREAWSGATLRGAARQYGARYASSRSNLMDRIKQVAEDFGVDIAEELVLCGSPRRWRRELLIRLPDGRQFLY